MKLAAMFGSSSSAIGATAVGAVVVVAGAVGLTVFNAEPDVPDPVAPAVEVAPEVVTPEVAVPEAVAIEEPAVEASPAFEAPRLDLVRVDADGNAVIAGQTSPDMAVVILLDGAVVAETIADGAGNFVSLLALEPSDAPRSLSVEARPEGAPALAGLETVLVAPFAAPAVALAAVEEPEPIPEVAEPVAQDPVVETPAFPDAAPEPTPQPTPQPTPEPAIEVAAAPEAPAEDLATAEVAAAAPPETPDFPAAPAAPPEAPGVLAAAPSALAVPSVTAVQPDVSADSRPAALQPARSAAPAVVIASPEGLRVVQGPTPEPAVQTSVRLDAISYNAQGAVILAGRGPAAADIQVYLNNQPIQLGEIGPGGDWSLQLPDVDPGTYTLAVAEIAGDGSTASRVETPFLREDPERVAEAPQAQAAGVDVITVQPGFTLWGIAENTFGEGILYVQIFEENRDQIRDPNWIFPGQIFRLPDSDTLNSGN